MATTKKGPKATPATPADDTASAQTAPIAPIDGAPIGRLEVETAAQILDVPVDLAATAPTQIEVLQDAEFVEMSGDIVPNEQADTDVSLVARTITAAATVGPDVDMLVTTRLDVPATARVADQDATASGDLMEVLTGNPEFAGVRGGVSFAGGRGLATAEQAERLVREFGYRAPALG